MTWQNTSCESQVEGLKALVEIKKCEFKAMSDEFNFTSYNLKYTSYEFKSMSSRII